MMGDDWRDKAGGLMCVGLSTPYLNDMTRALLDAGVSGVLLQGAAVSSPESVAELVHALKLYAGRSVFVALNHERTYAHAESSGFTPMPAASRLGETKDRELARQLGQVLGKELRAVGIDVTLGPVLDVTTGRHNPLASDRTLGDDPQNVAELAVALIEGQQSEGVAALGKHFPGYGDTAQDPNMILPELPHDVGRLEAVDLKPFQACIAARMAGMMVGHILFRALDDSFPASLSRAIIFGLLRQKLGYRGLVMIDDIDMAALTREFTRTEVAERGVASGADSFLCARRPESAFELIDAIARGVATGTIMPERIEAARRRIAPLLHRYVQDPGASPDLSAVGGGNRTEFLDRLREPRLSLVPKVG